MFGLNENTLATMLLVVFVVYMCMHSTQALRGGSSRNNSSPTFRRCPSCGFAVDLEHTSCPHCSAKLEDKGQDALA